MQLCAAVTSIRMGTIFKFGGQIRAQEVRAEVVCGAAVSSTLNDVVHVLWFPAASMAVTVPIRNLEGGPSVCENRHLNCHLNVARTPLGRNQCLPVNWLAMKIVCLRCLTC